jgi:hypothetical protein
VNNVAVAEAEKSPSASPNAGKADEQFGMKATPGAPLFSQGARAPAQKAFGINRLKAQEAKVHEREKCKQQLLKKKKN